MHPKLLIINSDDCGLSPAVNQAIERAIAAGKISSTTVMANMGDLPGAARLHREHGASISFGIHLNLTQGPPLTDSPAMRRSSFVVPDAGGGWRLNGQQFRYKPLGRALRAAVRAELDAQIEAVRAAGIRISHIDSHHHIHTAPFILPIVARLAREKGIRRIRAMRNYMPLSASRGLRWAWRLYLKILYPRAIMTQGFGIYEEFHRQPGLPMRGALELMCHCGGEPPREEELLMQADAERDFGARLINYNQL